jgi:hypothetical protein
MERELLETFEAAKKAADAVAGEDDSPEADRCLDALRRLRAIPVNTEVLVSTQVSGGLDPTLSIRLIRYPPVSSRHVVSCAYMQRGQSSFWAT